MSIEHITMQLLDQQFEAEAAAPEKGIIKEFGHVVYTREPLMTGTMLPGAIYINKEQHRATWLCPCGCGERMSVTFKPWPFELAYKLPDNVACIGINDEGEVSFNTGFVCSNCPRGLAYAITDNRVEIWGDNAGEGDNR